jgi:hypothetical protein
VPAQHRLLGGGKLSAIVFRLEQMSLGVDRLGDRASAETFRDKLKRQFEPAVNAA